MKFQDKVVVITGGSRGIGRAIATEFSSLGAKVVIISINQSSLDKAADYIKKETSNECAIFRGDVSNMLEMRKIFTAINSKFGRLDVLVNCAGINIRKNIFETT